MLNIIFLILLILGVALTCTFVFPGVPVMFLLTLVYGLLDHFEHIGPWQLSVFGAIALLTIIIDHVSGLIGAKIGGANKKSMIAGAVGLVIGLLAFPPFGAFLGLAIGIFLAELVQFQDHIRAFKAAGASFASMALGAILKIILALVFLILFIVFAF